MRICRSLLLDWLDEVGGSNQERVCVGGYVELMGPENREALDGFLLPSLGAKDGNEKEPSRTEHDDLP
jgi:hypothetical protein